MQKKLIALAVAGVMAAPLAAQAEATLYGKAHLTLNNYSSDFDNNLLPGGGSLDKGLTVDSNASRVGVKGSEDLGGGLSAVYQMEWQVDMANTGANLTARNTFAGLAGGFGTVVLGTHDTPYKMATGKLDLFADTAADYNAIIGNPEYSTGTNTAGAYLTLNGPSLDERYGNVLAYISPNFSGIQVAIAGVAAENGDDTFIGSSASVTYTGGPLYIGVAAEQVKDSTSGTKVGAGYNFGAGTVGVVYETGTQSDDTTDFDAWLVNGSFGLGSGNTLIAEYGVHTADMATDLETTLWSVGVAHGFSKATSAYAAYGNLTVDGGTAYDTGIFTFGLVHSF